MWRWRNRKISDSKKKDTGLAGQTTASPARVVSRRRTWLLRLIAAVGLPLLFFILLELSLRLAGYGHPTAFLLPDSRDGRKVFVQNNRFSWRFFGPRLARVPYPFSIPQVKAPDTVRIFVFGESAAFGDPEPRFGLPRMLQAMLRLRHPGVRFEVVNAGMTAINSHVILPIARDCATADGDIWVIYMGNNEVVGPFGAGTIFGPQVPPLPLIRASIAFKATRTGQLLDSLRQWLQKPPPKQGEWNGMEMFLGQQVPRDDPRMKTVYHDFERNLADIIRAGRHSGAGIVVSTVAVNLKDCAPFASAHRPGLSAPDLTKWEQFQQQGIQAQEAGKIQAAAEQFQAAAQLDDTFAELRFRQGECALALGKTGEAQQQFSAARDLDTLRFRCDSRLEDLIRQAASGHEVKRVLLTDTEQVFAENSTNGLPGEELFYDHVHLTFEGNYLLAKTLAGQVEKLLPEQIAAHTAPDRTWPSATDCARELVWNNWDKQKVLSEMFNAQMQHLKALMAPLASATEPEAMKTTREAYAQAVAAAPDDPMLRAQLGYLKRTAGDLAGAEADMRRVVELLPDNPENWDLLGLILIQEQHYEEAVVAYRRAFQCDPKKVKSLQNAAQALESLGRREEAIRAFRRVVAIKPDATLAWIRLGEILDGMGRQSQAEDCYHQALANHPHAATDLTLLARFCRSRGWLEAAVTNCAEAVKLNPMAPEFRIEMGRCFAASGRFAEAAQQFAEAVRLAPESAETHYAYGVDLGQAGKPVEAAEQFREAKRIAPDMLAARLNLGFALINQGRAAEALTEFEEVLQRSPTNAVALRNVQALRAKLAPKPAK
jgi:tetratricopeptide (TPR) repeat protein